MRQYLKKQLSDAPTIAARRRTIRITSGCQIKEWLPKRADPVQLCVGLLECLLFFGKRSHTTIHGGHLVQSKLRELLCLLAPLTLSPGCRVDSRSYLVSRYWSFSFCWASVSQRITMLMQQAVLLPESPITWVVTFSLWPQSHWVATHRIYLKGLFPCHGCASSRSGDVRFPNEWHILLNYTHKVTQRGTLDIDWDSRNSALINRRIARVGSSVSSEETLRGFASHSLHRVTTLEFLTHQVGINTTLTW